MEAIIYLSAAIVTISGIAAAAVRAGGHRDFGHWLACLAVVAVVVGGFGWWQKRFWEMDEAEKIIKERFLVPDSRPTPPRPKGLASSDQVKAFVFFGNTVAIADQFPFKAIEQESDKTQLLLMDLTDKGALEISAQFFSKSGKILGVIERNQFTLNKNEVFREKRTPHHLSVFNDENRLILDVDFLNPNCIMILGEFYSRKGMKIVASPTGLNIGGTGWSGGSIGGGPGIGIAVP